MLGTKKKKKKKTGGGRKSLQGTGSRIDGGAVVRANREENLLEPGKGFRGWGTKV